MSDTGEGEGASVPATKKVKVETCEMTKEPQGTATISFDVEADGDSPTMTNMLSIGLYVFDELGDEVCTYQRNIKPRRNKVPDERCMQEFWYRNPKAWAFVQQDQIAAEDCMDEISELLGNLKKRFQKIRWVARPASYDWQWLNGYYDEFGAKDKTRLGFKARCISTMFDVYKAVNNLTKKEEDAAWDRMTAGHSMTHNPLDDAKFQAVLYIGLCKELHMDL